MMEWINVQDKLPENYTSVVFAWEWNEGEDLQFGAGEYFDDAFYSDAGDLANGPYSAVKYWAALSQPKSSE